MPILGRFEFTPPRDFIDATEYTYSCERPFGELTILVEPPDDDDATPADMLARASRAVESLTASAVEQSPPRPRTIAGRPGLTQTHAINEATPIVVRLAVVPAPRDELATLSFAAEAADRAASTQFEHCLDSLRFDAVPLPPAPGYHRAMPAGLALDVPDHLVRPALLLYLGPGELVRVRLSLQPPHAALAALVAAEVRGARPAIVPIRAGVKGELEGEWCSLGDTAGRGDSVVQALVRHPAAAESLWIVGRAPRPAIDAATSVVRQLLTSCCATVVAPRSP